MSSNSYSITKEQSDAIEKIYHYKEILESLKEAIVICGNVTIGEAIDMMKKKAFYNEPSPCLSELQKLNEHVEFLRSKENDR